MQIIIFKSGKNKSSSHKISGLLFLLLVISIVASLTFMFSSASYIYGYKHGFEELHEDRIADIEKYKNEINSIKYENKDGVTIDSSDIEYTVSEDSNFNIKTFLRDSDSLSESLFQTVTYPIQKIDNILNSVNPNRSKSIPLYYRL